MKIKSFFYVAFLSAFIFCTASCSDDDDNFADPVGTVSLNMMNEDNGKTELGHSDVYIDNANNFCSNSCLLSSLGKKKGLGSIQDMQFKAGTNKAAVELGNAYQIFKSNAVMKFPSGKMALRIDSDYYNVYAVSPIKKDNAEVVGANVKFVLMDIPHNDLPEYGSAVGLIDHVRPNTWEVAIDLPTADFEYEPTFSNVLNKLEHEKDGNRIIVRLVRYDGYNQSLGFYIRIEDSYTYVFVELK